LHTVEVCFKFLSLEGQRCPVDLRSLERKLESLVVESSARPSNLFGATSN
jgi:hypothetical protein